MVGIVVVSHSRALADAAVNLAVDMVPAAELRIEVAAGLDEDIFGTDATAIAAAITAADHGAGVLVLMDVGSAVLSTDLALEMLEEDVRTRVRLSAAPLVEGLLAAAVAAAGGAGLEEVATEAEAGLAGKAAQLSRAAALTEPAEQLGSRQPLASPEPPESGKRSGFPTPPAPPGSPPRLGSPGVEPAESEAAHTELTGLTSARFVLTSQHGLHARPAARLARLAGQLGADVRIRNLTTESDWVSARSLSRLTTLGALRGHELEVSASGPGAQAAIDAVTAGARKNFGDPPAAAPTPTPTHVPASPSPSPGPGQWAVAATTRRENLQQLHSFSGTVLRGLSASPGIGVGPATRLPADSPIEVPDHPVGSPAEEQQRLQDALASAAGELGSLRARIVGQVGADEASIFDAHLALLDDPELLADVASRIRAGQSAERAWASAIESIERAVRRLDNGYLRERAADMRAVRDQVLLALGGRSVPAQPGEGVLIASDLNPTQAASLDPALTTGVALAFGSPTSHAAILIRARGVPMVVDVGAQLLALPDGSDIAVDGDTGQVHLQPDEQARGTLLVEARRQSEARTIAVRASGQPALTADGLQILVGANLGSVDDALAAAASGADLAGLVRTEFLFLDRETAPDVDEQVETYRALADALGGRRLTLRTLDVGGDKPLTYAPVPPSANPFLGLRGLRLSLARPALFAAQLRAIARVARETPVSVMFPMVSTLAEVHEARGILDGVIAADGQRGTPAGLEVGIMVEVPAVALKAAEFAPAVDFFSIGTNDLTQYALAAERGNPDVAATGDAYDPGVLALIRAVCVGAGDGPHVAVCGNLASDPGAAALLIGLGVGTLSVSPPAVPLVKQAVRRVDGAHAEDLAATAIGLPGPQEVRALLGPSSARGEIRTQLATDPRPEAADPSATPD